MPELPVDADDPVHLRGLIHGKDAEQTPRVGHVCGRGRRLRGGFLERYVDVQALDPVVEPLRLLEREI